MYTSFVSIGRDASMLNEHPGVVAVEFNGGYELYRFDANDQMEMVKSYSSKVQYGFGLMKSKKNNYYIVVAKLKDEKATTLYFDVFEVSTTAEASKSNDLSFTNTKSISYLKHGAIDQVIPTIVEGKRYKRKCRIF